MTNRSFMNAIFHIVELQETLENEMATYHLSIKSGKKGKATQHSDYIARKGASSKREDLVLHKVGNLPEWAGGSSRYFWKMADTHERKNGAAYREYELALPRELTLRQQETLIDDFIARNLKGKTFEVAIHVPNAALEGNPQAHSHIMFSDRMDDGIERLPNQHFLKFNSAYPERGGCKKDSGGKDKAMMREHAMELRRSWEEIQNTALARHGHIERVDCRSHRDRNINIEPERHLGACRVRRMSKEERDGVLAVRATHPDA